MGVEQGINPSFPYDADRDGVRMKPQYHRPGLVFRTEGFVVTLNKANPVRGTDWTPRNHATTVKTEAAQGATVIAVNSVKLFAKYRPVTFDRGGAGEEVHNVTGLDVAAKTITIAEGLTNTQAVGKAVDQDQVYVSSADGVTTVIEVILMGQNAVSTLAGADLQFAKVRISDPAGWDDGDRIDGELRVPYAVGASVLGALFADEVYEVAGNTELTNDSSESASAVDPNYFLRVTFKSGADTPTAKKMRFKFGTWRV